VAFTLNRSGPFAVPLRIASVLVGLSKIKTGRTFKSPQSLNVNVLLAGVISL
jgi:hypothetical protein